jgi:hypothetical protein
MRLFLAATALGAMLVATVGAADPGAAKPRKLTARGPVLALAADGDRAAFNVGLGGNCASLSVWEPTRGRIVRLRPRSRCDSAHRNSHLLALAGTRAAWLWTTGGNFLETIIITDTLARPQPVRLAGGISDDPGGISGSLAREPVCDGTLLVFTLERRCGEFEGAQYPCPPGRKTGDIVAATLWRIGGRGPCPGTSSGPVRGCSRVANADGELSVLAVDAGRIAVRTESQVKLLTAAGRSLQAFPVRPRAAALSGNRIALRTANAVEVYGTDTGDLLKTFPAPNNLRLQDLDRDILVTASAGTVTLRRVGSGQRTTIKPGSTAFAQLEPSGLFIAAHRRLTFTPMRNVLRWLGG